MPALSRRFICQACGALSAKWAGQCPRCGQWNSLAEEQASQQGSLTPLDSIPMTTHARRPTSFAEVDRVLGGGLVPGSVVLLGGEPGIGKSTLLLQLAAALATADGPACYISGEESAQQIKLRAERLHLRGQHVLVAAETDLSAALAILERSHPGLAIVDSVQALRDPKVEGGPGTLAQVRQCALALAHWAKGHDTPVVLAGHVTKDGALAGPKALEHLVDVVLYLEGDTQGPYRLLRGAKNRFGSTNEVGVFEMGDQGLRGVPDASKHFLSERSVGAAGSAVVPVMEGTRPLLVEVQALTTPTAFGTPRRAANGLDYNRLLLIAAVLTRRAGLPLAAQDIMVSAVGGLRVEEPAADLALALAIASSYHNRPLDPGLVAIGEVGLTGEIRAVGQVERRLAEAAALGFATALVPASLAGTIATGKALRPLFARTVIEALRLANLSGRAAQAASAEAVARTPLEADI